MISLAALSKRLDSYQHWGLFLLRVFLAFRLIYGVIDNMLSWERMLDFSKFLEASGFPFPTVNAVISVYAQFLCSLLLLTGYQVRLAASVLIINFLVAFGVHLFAGDSLDNMFPALTIIFICIAILFYGKPSSLLRKSN